MGPSPLACLGKNRSVGSISLPENRSVIFGELIGSWGYGWRVQRNNGLVSLVQGLEIRPGIEPWRLLSTVSRSHGECLHLPWIKGSVHSSSPPMTDLHRSDQRSFGVRDPFEGTWFEDHGSPWKGSSDPGTGVHGSFARPRKMRMLCACMHPC